MKFGGFKGQMMIYPKKQLDMEKKSIWRLQSKMAANNNRNALKKFVIMIQP